MMKVNGWRRLILLCCLGLLQLLCARYGWRRLLDVHLIRS